ncbi:hypothetical protein J2Z21_005784 [Streptomyces griseochromogenes]|uniref:Uncharacterized protein n=1 Tax=Streptomyces griseochromogenes TaxID=68214 RepID=A0A1B1APN8_9ACTN|nr:hypothetical protein [Streptomyces griseochromogenes]ANP48526.1 hypothetical protein AVL59_02105 [Streptomyces griseochromogenes]MBP2052795.1 hypothetical protein [Streptomyces griseochromogenes]
MTGLALAAGTLPLIFAGTAQASAFDCMKYLDSKGYRVGPKVEAACNLDEGSCILELGKLHVAQPVKLEACYRIHR